MKNLKIDRTNAACGAFLMLAGLFFAVQSARLEIGSAFRMGPGYFPLVLAIILIGLGIVVAISAINAESEGIGPIAWRGMLFILVAPILFGILLRGFGFLPSIFISALVAGFASTRMKVTYAVLLAAGLTLFATLVFVKGLGLPFRLFGPWLGL